jgi:hypothetical protein
MSFTRFTEGPWRVDKYGCIVQHNTRDGGDVIRAGGLALCTNDGEPKYNRYLIASSPELYQQLEESNDCMLALVDTLKDYGYSPHDLLEQIKWNELVLAKARGE